MDVPDCLYVIKKELYRLVKFFLVMQEKRLELSWYCYHTDLNRARLPIPPFLRTKIIISGFPESVNYFLKNFKKFVGNFIA